MIEFHTVNKAKEVCDHFGKAIKDDSKSGIQMSRETICENNNVFFVFFQINNLKIVSLLFMTFFKYFYLFI